MSWIIYIAEVYLVKRFNDSSKYLRKNKTFYSSYKNPVHSLYLFEL